MINILKIGTSKILTTVVLNIEQVGVTILQCVQKGADGIANNVNPEEQSDLAPHCLLRPI